MSAHKFYKKRQIEEARRLGVIGQDEAEQDLIRKVFPPEWAQFPVPQDRFDHLISLFEGIDELGKVLYGGEWTGNERYARSPKKIEEWENIGLNERIHRFMWIHGDGEIVRAVNFGYDEESAAFVLKEKVYRALLAGLAKGKIEAFYFDCEGRKYEAFEQKEWRDVIKAYEIFDTINPCGSIGGYSNEDVHRQAVYLDREQLQTFLEEINSSKTRPASIQPKKRRGRKTGDGQILGDDDRVDHMKFLIDQQKAKSVNDAAVKTIEEFGLSGASENADIRRLTGKYNKKFSSK